MKKYIYFGVLLVILCCGEQAGRAQPLPHKGVVWEVPPDSEQAAQELLDLAQLGAEAVRTGIIREARLFDLADSLGLQFYQELPLDYLPAASLRDTLSYAVRVLELMFSVARNHPSARHFGLARRSDTSDPAACMFFERLAQHARRNAPRGSLVYYVSVFIEDDRCGSTVDFVLLDVRDAPDPGERLARWRVAQGDSGQHRVGLGAVGLWVDGASAQGLRHPHSASSQARYLETHLNTLLDPASGPPPEAVFIYRWRDEVSTVPSPAYDLEAPFEERYGLYTSDGAPRPSREVVHGLFTGRQTVFAFPVGVAPRSGVPWALLVGWVVLALIAGCYAVSPRFQHMVPRYFQARGFYREAIREGRDTLLGTSGILLASLSLSIGVLGSSTAEVVRQEEAFQLLLGAFPRSVQVVGVALLAQPWLLVLLLSGVYALGAALWTASLSFASRRCHPLIPGQALMLVIWPRWFFLVLMVGAMVVPTLPSSVVMPFVGGLMGVWLLGTLLAILKTLFDYRAITHCSPYRVVGVGCTNPLILLLLFVLFALIDLGPMFTFIWHLGTRS